MIWQESVSQGSRNAGTGDEPGSRAGSSASALTELFGPVTFFGLFDKHKCKAFEVAEHSAADRTSPVDAKQARTADISSAHGMFKAAVGGSDGMGCRSKGIDAGDAMGNG